MIDTQFSFHPVPIPGGKVVQIALPIVSSDPVVNAYKAGQRLNDYLIEYLCRFTTSGQYVLDLGCHVGTLAVPAAATARKVLAVDASPLHVAAVRLSAERNEVADLRVEWSVVAQVEGEVEFLENGLWGMVSGQHKGALDAIVVPARRADALIRAAGWPRVDFVKIDIEGSELAAIESLGAYLKDDGAPVIVYESNGMTFDIFGYAIADIRFRLEALGYETYRFERPHFVYCPPTELQPEAWLDLVALPAKWRKADLSILRKWPSESLVARCLEWGTNEHRNVREYLHRAFAGCSTFPRADKRIVALRRRLELEFGAVE